MKAIRSIKLLTFATWFFILLVFAAVGYGQDGGVNSNFTDGGVGSRALSLGGAFVAQSDDATAVYWNPGALDYLEKRSLSVYYSSLNYGTSYNFIGFVYPALSIGGFGFGWLRIGTGDIEQRDSNVPIADAIGDFSENLFIFSYGRQLRKSLGVGISLKIERKSFSFGNTSDSGVGADFGLMYRPNLDNIFRNTVLAINFQNILTPRIRFEEKTDSSPLNFKAGLSKYFAIGDDRNLLRFLFDFNKTTDGPQTLHFGTEYSFGESASLRLGFNDGQVAFGAGAGYSNFKLDYTFGKFFDGTDFSSSHRFTISVDFGKSKSELIRIAKERRDREMRLQIENELWFNAESDFNDRMEKGRTKYYGKDFLGAFVDFASALESATSLQEISMRLRGEIADDPEANMRVETANSSIQEAQIWLDQANVKSDSVRRAEQRQIILQARQSAIEKELQDFILEHKEKGIAFFKSGFFRKAIDEWQLAIDRINRSDLANLPSWVAEVKLQLENDVNTAEKQLKGNIEETIGKADRMARRGQYVEALDVLNSIRGAGLTDSERKEIERKINRLQSQLSYDQNYKDGVRYYANKEWKKAEEAFKRALNSKRGDVRAQKYYEEAHARAIATVQQMPASIRVKFSRGVALYRQGKYREALDIWEQIRKEQPYNKRILESIDRAKEKLNQ